jgi:23S rRNA (cytosine1962-C5)-methyltransferase
VAHGMFDPDSPIAVRVFSTRRDEPFSPELLARRVTTAIARRDGLIDPARTDALRLCNGEGDRAPGFVLDRYASVAVARLDTEALAGHLERVEPAITAALGARGVASLALRKPRGSGDASLIDTLSGPEAPARTWVLESGMRMEVDLARGQKTGAFLDQRENRARVGALASGRREVLNLFSYAGGFSAAAALGGAARVTSVDVAAQGHASAQRTFRENGLDPSAHVFVTADVFAFLEQAERRGARFDLVISDPPSFAPNERAKAKALGAYRKLHGAIAKVLADKALFCAASCSSHVTAEEFLATLDDPTLGRSDLRVLEVRGQPADHPTVPAWPEGRYLKFVLLG